MLIDRYLIRQVVTTFAAISSVLIAIFVTYSVTRFLTDAAGGLLKAGEVAHLTLFKSIIALEVLLPLAFYLGLIIAVGRLNANSEITAMITSGISMQRLWRPLILVSLLLASAIALLSASVRPWAYNAMYTLRAQAEASSELNRIRPQRFYLYEEQDRAIYIEAIGKRGENLSGIFIRNANVGDVEVISAPAGTLQAFVTPDQHQLVLENASIYKSIADGPDFYGNFGRLTLALTAKQVAPPDYRSKSETTPALYLSSLPDDRAEFQWRLSTPVSTLLLALMALILSGSKSRQGKYARLPLAIGIYAVYYNLLTVSRTCVEHGTLDTIWWAPAVLSVIVAMSMPWRRQPRRI